MSPVNTDRICCFEVLCFFFNVVETVTLRTQKSIPPYYVTSVIKIVFYLEFLCFWRDNLPVGQGLLIYEVSRSHKRRTAVGMSPLDD
jgi:hypothetical protein